MSAFYLFLCAAVIGVVEGVTEWLPVSSTGHMILIDACLGMKEHVSESFYSFFLVAVQLGAILAVIVLYFKRLNPWRREASLPEKRQIFRLWRCVFIGMLPAALLGIPLDDFIEEKLYGVPVIATALILYGVLFILIERKKKNGFDRIESVYDLTYCDAWMIGCFQALSLIPGTSRSGSTILGGMLLGVSRTASAEFSFFMATPVMAGASLIRGAKLFATGVKMTGTELSLLLIGMLTAFAVSLLAIRFLMNFVRRHSFEAFGWYRILFGILVLSISLLAR
ncbi:MAG: undecaprenyl-diphosphate phosphatase [Ruminococcaceae bacterium]|nr:undecaprenyl-diphosphate phosphatase [Oscillospiraceae bacterium]